MANGQNNSILNQLLSSQTANTRNVNGTSQNGQSANNDDLLERFGDDFIKAQRILAGADVGQDSVGQVDSTSVTAGVADNSDLKQKFGSDFDRAMEILGQQPERSFGERREGGLLRVDDFAQFPLKEIDISPSPLNFMQNLVLGLAPSDESKLGFLKDQFPEANIEFDVTKGILINGARVNPLGFDFGDIPRNSGDILTISGQILFGVLGGVLGGTAGTPILPGAGTVTGALVGSATFGAAGALLGRGLQLAGADLLGLDLDGREVWDTLTEEAKVAVASEVVGLGISKGISRLGTPKLTRGLSDIWPKIINKLQKVAGGERAKKDILPAILRFVGDIDNSASVITLTSPKGVKGVLNERNFDPRAMVKNVSRALFGKEDIVNMDSFLSSDVPVTRGMVEILKSIKSLNDPVFDNFIIDLSRNRLSTETIGTLKRASLNEILTPANFSVNRPFNIADKFAKEVISREQELGEILGEAVKRVLINRGGDKFNVRPFAQGFLNDIEQIGILNRIRVEGFDPGKTIPIAGRKQLNSLLDIFRSTKKGEGAGLILRPPRFDPKRVAAEKEFFGQVPLTELKNMLDTFNIKVDEVFRSTDIPGVIKRVVAQNAQKFRRSYYNALGLAQESGNFRAIKALTDDFKVEDKLGFINRMEGLIRGFPKKSGAIRGQIDAILNVLSPGKAGAFRKQIDLYNAGSELGRVDVTDMFKKLESDLSRKNILSNVVDDFSESKLRDVDNFFLRSKKLKDRAFFGQAQNILAAREFNKDGVNLLRIGAIANLLGFSNLGGFAGEKVAGKPGKEMGQLLGGLTALSLSNPRVLARILIKYDREIGRFSRLGMRGERLLKRMQKTIISDVKDVNLEKRLRDRIGERTLKTLISRPAAERFLQ